MIRWNSEKVANERRSAMVTSRAGSWPFVLGPDEGTGTPRCLVWPPVWKGLLPSPSPRQRRFGSLGWVVRMEKGRS